MNRQRSTNRVFAGAIALLLIPGSHVVGQLRTADVQASRDNGSVRHASAWTNRSAAPNVRELDGERKKLSVRQHHSQLMVAKNRVTRIAMTSPDVANFVQYSESEIAIIGLQPGSTDLTLWFDGDPTPVIYDVTVTAPVRQDAAGKVIADVTGRLKSVFPRSRVQLIPVADQIVVKGQAWDTDEAAAIMQLLESQFGGKSRTVLNMLRVPGEFQVLLKARIAELDRRQMRRLGVDCRELLSRSRQTADFGPASAGISGVFTRQQTDRLMKWMVSNGTISYLAEPSLTVLSGHTGSFLSGGEFAVKTADGNGGTNTEFRRYGTSLKVTPTVVDRDLIRLRLTPEFSQLNDRTVDGVPGTNVRRVDTVVELREGQTIAIGGLVARQMLAEQARKPGFRDLFTRRKATEAETELLIIVTPELVRPMDAHELPPLPNHYVTHPSNCELESGLTEGQPVTTMPPSEFEIQAISAPVYRYEPARRSQKPIARSSSASSSRSTAVQPPFPPHSTSTHPETLPVPAPPARGVSESRSIGNAPSPVSSSPTAKKPTGALPLVRSGVVNRSRRADSSIRNTAEATRNATHNTRSVPALPAAARTAVSTDATAKPIVKKPAGPALSKPKSTPSLSSAASVPRQTKQSLQINPPRPAAQLPRIGGHTLPIRTSDKPVQSFERFPLPAATETPKRTQSRSLPGLGHSIP